MTNEEIDKLVNSRAEDGLNDTKRIVDAGMRDLAFQAAIANSLQTIVFLIAEGVKRMQYRDPCTHEVWTSLEFIGKAKCSMCGLLVDMKGDHAGGNSWKRDFIE